MRLKRLLTLAALIASSATSVPPTCEESTAAAESSSAYTTAAPHAANPPHAPSSPSFAAALRSVLQPWSSLFYSEAGSSSRSRSSSSYHNHHYQQQQQQQQQPHGDDPYGSDPLSGPSLTANLMGLSREADSEAAAVAAPASPMEATTPSMPPPSSPPPLPPTAPRGVDVAQPQRQAALRRAMLHAWRGYSTHAWGMDEYDPITQSGDVSFGMGLTLVDTLDTLLVMGLYAEASAAIEWVGASLSFGEQEEINLFEVTIRVLGGLLSAYEATGEEALLARADELGSRLLFAFHTPSGLPFGTLGLRSKKRYNPTWSKGASTVAEVATLQLEFRALSRHTGNPEYEAVAQRVMDHLRELRTPPQMVSGGGGGGGSSSSSTTEQQQQQQQQEQQQEQQRAAAAAAAQEARWPSDLPAGLYPMFISPETGQFTSSEITLGARADSLYEYLLKQWLLSGKTDDRMRKMYDESVASIRRFLVRTGGRSRCSNCTYIGTWNHRTKQYKEQMDHLVCFVPGMLALGAAHGSETYDEDMDLARRLMETCYRMYADSPSGLAPEIAEFSHPTKVIAAPTAKHNLLRPETVESLFLMWRLTGDSRYREYGWKIFLAFEQHTKVVAGGYAPVRDVTLPAGRIERKGKMESFFTAETLKYLYLLFGDGSQYPLDEFVFNTEAHPLRIRPEYEWGAEWGSLPTLSDLMQQQQEQQEAARVAARNASLLHNASGAAEAEAETARLWSHAFARAELLATIPKQPARR